MKRWWYITNSSGKYNLNRGDVIIIYYGDKTMNNMDIVFRHRSDNTWFCEINGTGKPSGKQYLTRDVGEIVTNKKAFLKALFEAK